MCYVPFEPSEFVKKKYSCDFFFRVRNLQKTHEKICNGLKRAEKI